MTLVEWFATSWSSKKSRNEAARLNRQGGRMTCRHGRSPCYSMCGVARSGTRGRWEPIEELERYRWFGRLMGLVFRDRLERSTP